MKRISILFVVLALIISATNFASAAPKASKAPKAAKPTVGSVVCLPDFIKGTLTITKDDAVAKAEKGSPIVLKVGEGKKAKLYFIINEDGSFGSKNLAKYAANKKVAVEGAIKTIAGVNYIIATKISSFD